MGLWSCSFPSAKSACACCPLLAYVLLCLVHPQACSVVHCPSHKLICVPDDQRRPQSIFQKRAQIWSVTCVQGPEEEELLADALSLLAYESPADSPCGHMLREVRGAPPVPLACTDTGSALASAPSLVTSQSPAAARSLMPPPLTASIHFIRSKRGPHPAPGGDGVFVPTPCPINSTCYQSDWVP